MSPISDSDRPLISPHTSRVLVMATARPFVLLLALLVVGPLLQTARAQGCVAIRHFSTPSEFGFGHGIMPGDLTFSTSYRYFKSFRHFRGSHEEPDRVANGTEVINHAHSIDLSVTYAVTSRMYAALSIPYVINTRSSLYEHGQTERNTSFSRGIADARVGVGYWILPPGVDRPLSGSVGVSLKLPTGNFNATDIFYNVGVDGRPEVRPVDQSIQPGDGGVGYLADFQFHHRITSRFAWYGGGFYLLNPRETNGVHTFRETLSPLLANEAITSVPDQFSVRAGGTYVVPEARTAFSLGVRYEGVPVEDLVGGSAGFRRPGSVFSVEPAVSYTHDAVTLSLALPIALIRNRPQSVTDLETQQLTGEPRAGDAAFADYLLSVGVSYRFGRRQASSRPDLPDLFDGPNLVPDSAQ